MKLSSNHISAFLELAQTKSFSLAAIKLGITQSALSQRIAQLESDLEMTLVIREPSGLKITPQGEIFLRYCQSVNSLEDEVLNKLQKSSDLYSGTIRIAGFSSVMRSLIIPPLSPFLRENPAVNCEFQSFEVVDLYDTLKSAKADLVILDYELNKEGIIQHVIGLEDYVVIESSRFKTPKDIYLDHGPHDNATTSFFEFQGIKESTYRRAFMGDVYGIIDGVENGLGRAVMSKHLIVKNKNVKVLSGYKRYNRKITLHYYQQSFYPKIHQKIVEILQALTKPSATRSS
jgi:DNA-binding transcriptional LysR family regulator